MDAVREMGAALRNEYRVTDPGARIRWRPPRRRRPMDAASTRQVLCMLPCLPNGVQAMSAEIHGLVQTSLNLGILTTAGLPGGPPSACAVRWTPRGDAEGPPGLPDGGAGRQRWSFFGDYTGWSTWLTPPCGAPGGGLPRAVQARAQASRPSTPAWSAAFSPASCPAWTAYPSVPTCLRSTLPGSA